MATDCKWDDRKYMQLVWTQKHRSLGFGKLIWFVVLRLSWGPSRFEVPKHIKQSLSGLETHENSGN
jgi:hypothetical protein